MKVKLDENLPLQVAVELRARLHDVQTVWEEGLSGHADLDKTWISRTRESLCPGRTTGSCSYACARPADGT
jgi:hypothetical protein